MSHYQNEHLVNAYNWADLDQIARDQMMSACAQHTMRERIRFREGGEFSLIQKDIGVLLTVERDGIEVSITLDTQGVEAIMKSLSRVVASENKRAHLLRQLAELDR